MNSLASAKCCLTLTYITNYHCIVHTIRGYQNAVYDSIFHKTISFRLNWYSRYFCIYSFGLLDSFVHLIAVYFNFADDVLICSLRRNFDFSFVGVCPSEKLWQYLRRWRLWRMFQTLYGGEINVQQSILYYYQTLQQESI